MSIINENNLDILNNNSNNHSNEKYMKKKILKVNNHSE